MNDLTLNESWSDELHSIAQGMNLCFVLPTRNESATIVELIESLQNIGKDAGFKSVSVIVTDDSKDLTRKLAKEHGAIVINGGGKGLGYAMFRGLKASLLEKPDLIVTMDADGQADPTEFYKFAEPVLKDRADLVIGSRFLEGKHVKYHYKFINRFGIRILSKILRSFTGLKITDSHGGVRAMRPEVVKELEMIGTHTYVQETIIDAYEKGFRILELPSIWLERKAGKSRVVGSIPRYVLYTLPVLILRSGKYLTWLYTLGLLLVMSAFLYFGIILVEENFAIKELFNRLPALVLIALLILTGFQFLFFGFVLNILKEIKHKVDRLE